jgi:hypothetical protein
VHKMPPPQKIKKIKKNRYSRKTDFSSKNGMLSTIQQKETFFINENETKKSKELL